MKIPGKLTHLIYISLPQPLPPCWPMLDMTKLRSRAKLMLAGEDGGEEKEEPQGNATRRVSGR